MKIAVKIAFMAAATIPAAASAQEAGRMLSLDEAVAVTLTENPALKAAAYEERAAQQQRRAAIGLRMPQINVTGAYAYMAKDIGFDFNDLKGPVKDSDAPGASEPDDGCRLVPQGAGSEPRIRGRRGDRPDLDGRQDQRREPRRADQREDGRRAEQPDPQRADLGTRGALFRTGPRHAGRRRASAGGGRRAQASRRRPGARTQRHDRPDRTPLRGVQDGRGRTGAGKRQTVR